MIIVKYLLYIIGMVVCGLTFISMLDADSTYPIWLRIFTAVVTFSSFFFLPYYTYKATQLSKKTPIKRKLRYL